MNCPQCGTPGYQLFIGFRCDMPGCANSDRPELVVGTYDWARLVYCRGWPVSYYDVGQRKWWATAPIGSAGLWVLRAGPVTWRREPGPSVGQRWCE